MKMLKSMFLAVTVLAILAVNLFGGVSIRQGKNPVLIDNRGKPFVAKGVVYYQPQAAHNYFLSKVDLEKAAEDFDLFKTYGFNTVALDVNWGELITRVDDTDGYKPIVINNENIAKLKALVQLAADKGMFAYIFPLNQIVPMEVEASEIIGGYDEGGNYIDTFRGFCVKNWQMDPALNKGFLSFMHLLGESLSGYDNIVCYSFSYESTEQWWPWCHEDDLLIEGWRKYLKDRNSDVDYWKTRWNEQDADYAEIDEIILPYRDREFWKPYYDAKGMKPIESDPLKWRDYYHFMFVEVCRDGKYGLSIPQMAEAIREGDSDALVMLKNMDPDRYAWELGALKEFKAGKLPGDVAEIIKAKYSYPGLDMIACDAYPTAHKDPYKRAEELTFERDLKRIADYKKVSPLPIFCQEFGCNHEEWSTYEGAKYIANALKGFKRARLLGYNVWQSHDFEVSPQYGRVQANFGIFSKDGTPNVKADAFADSQGGNPAERARNVWDNLLDDQRMKYHGYFFHSDVLEHKEEVKEIRTYCNMIFSNTFRIEGASSGVHDMLMGDLADVPQEFFDKAAARLRFIDSLGFQIISDFFTPLLQVNPDREAYKARLLEIKRRVPELDLVDIFYIADEPDINPLQTKELLETSIAVMKEVFPHAKSSLCYAQVEPRMLDVVPPDNMDILMIDPYFLRDYTGGTSPRDFEHLYRSRFATTLSWANRWNKPFLIIGDVFWGQTEGGKQKPTPESIKWFYEIAMTQPNCVGLGWFLYGILDNHEGLRGIKEGDPASEDLLAVVKETGKLILDEEPSLMGIGWCAEPMPLPEELEKRLEDAEKANAPKTLGLSVQHRQFIKDGKPYYGMGVNYFDAFYRVLIDHGDKSYMEGFRILRQKYDIPFARVMFSGFWPNENKLYFDDKEKYFALMDELVATAEEQKLGLIPSLFWFIGLVPDMMGEHMDAYGDPDSKTTQHMKTYIREVVGRYKDSPAIWAWELGNEWMLQVDIPDEKHARVMTSPEQGSPEKRDPVKDWVKRNDVRVAYRMFADEVRKVDPTRMVCYGDALCPNTAYNMHYNQNWDIDTREQWMKMFKGDNVGADCDSVHIYPFQDETYFPDKAPIEETIRLCNSSGKPLFIGEFGAPVELGAKEAKIFYDRLIKVIIEDQVPLSALWVYDFDLQVGLWNVTHDNDRAYMLDAIIEVNKQFKELGLQ